MDDIRRSGRLFVAPLCPIGVYTSTCLSVVSVMIVAKLDRRCGHEDRWQDLLVSGTSLVHLVECAGP